MLRVKFIQKLSNLVVGVPLNQRQLGKKNTFWIGPMKLIELRPWGNLGEVSEENSHEILNSFVEQRVGTKKKEQGQLKQILLLVVS